MAVGIAENCQHGVKPLNRIVQNSCQQHHCSTSFIYERHRADSTKPALNIRHRTVCLSASPALSRHFKLPRSRRRPRARIENELVPTPSGRKKSDAFVEPVIASACRYRRADVYSRATADSASQSSRRRKLRLLHQDATSIVRLSVHAVDGTVSTRLQWRHNGDDTRRNKTTSM